MGQQQLAGNIHWAEEVGAPLASTTTELGSIGGWQIWEAQGRMAAGWKEHNAWCEVEGDVITPCTIVSPLLERGGRRYIVGCRTFTTSSDKS